MRTEDFPVSGAQPLKHGFSYLPAKGGVGIHGSHQNGRILVIFCLLRSKTVDIDVHISGKGNVVLIIDENDFTGKMSALSLINFKAQISEVKESDLGQRIAKLGDVQPGGL